MDAQDETPQDQLSPLDGTAEVGKRCRDMVSVTIRAFVDLMQRASVNGQIPLDQAQRIANAIMSAGGPLAAYYAKTEQHCDAIAQLGTLERKRTDFFGRLITEPFARMLDDADSGMDRKRLPQFFAAVRMIVGDETHADLKARCTVIAEEHRSLQGLIDWAGFYDDPDAEQVLEQVLVTIARSFRRFEPRKDWFMIVMNSNPTSISLGQNAFVPKKTEDKVSAEFTEGHMAALFEALFERFRPEKMNKARRNTFIARWGSDPEKLMGPLFGEIAMLKRRAATAAANKAS